MLNLLNKKLLGNIKLKRHYIKYLQNYLIETKNGDFFVIIRGTLVRKDEYDGTKFYKQNRLYVKKIEWVFDNYKISPLNNFDNKEYHEELLYKPVAKGEEIKCYENFCKNIKTVYNNCVRKVINRIHEGPKKPEKTVICYDYIF